MCEALSYLRRQIYVLDTYPTPAVKHVNHAMLLLYTYASIGIFVPLLVLVLSVIYAFLYICLKLNMVAISGAGTTMIDVPLNLRKWKNRSSHKIGQYSWLSKALNQRMVKIQTFDWLLVCIFIFPTFDINQCSFRRCGSVFTIGIDIISIHAIHAKGSRQSLYRAQWCEHNGICA